jgi:cell filamentation protein, protein adenylyltransferase
VTFDPFGDFETRGYLRNVAEAKNPEIVRRLQHNSFTTGIIGAPPRWQADSLRRILRGWPLSLRRPME